MQKARRYPVGLRPLVGNWFQVLFHSPVRGSFHLSLTVLCAIGLSRVFSLAGWSRLIRPGFLVSGGTQDTAGLHSASHTGVSPSMPHSSICLCSPHSCRIAVLQPRPVREPVGLGFSPFARHYSGNHFCFLFLPLLRCFSSRRSPTSIGVTDLQSAGLPHSEISGSRVICTSPELFAAYRVLLRLREPRHPPVALSYFFFLFVPVTDPVARTRPVVTSVILRLSMLLSSIACRQACSLCLYY